MCAKVRILAGPARSGKTARLIAQYRRVISESPIGTGLWLTPTRHAAREVRELLLTTSSGFVGCLSPGIFTFPQLAQTLLNISDRRQRFVGKLLKRQLIKRILRTELAAGRLDHFAPIADRPGLIDLLDSFIADLKRQQISPDEFAACTAGSPAAKNKELAAIFAAYEHLLNGHQLQDAEGQFSAARDVLKSTEKKYWGSLASVKHIIVDGFSDFTRTQQEILQLLTREADELTVSLPLEKQSGRKELFDKPARTAEQLQQRFRNVLVEWIERPAESGWPAMAHLECQLFTNPRNLSRCKNAAGIEVVAAAGQRAEIEMVARRVKHLLVCGDNNRSDQPIPASQIAIAFRSLESIAPLVEEIFDSYGIPTAIDSSPPLSGSPVLRALVDLLRLQAADWPFRQLLAVLSSNFFRPDWPEWHVDSEFTQHHDRRRG